VTALSTSGLFGNIASADLTAPTHRTQALRTTKCNGRCEGRPTAAADQLDTRWPSLSADEYARRCEADCGAVGRDSVSAWR